MRTRKGSHPRVNRHVLLKRIFVTKRSWAQLARERFVALVGYLMDFQSSILREGFSANLARKQFLNGMCGHVFRKIGFARAEGHRRPVPNGQFSNPVTVVLEEIQMLALFLPKF